MERTSGINGRPYSTGFEGGLLHKAPQRPEGMGDASYAALSSIMLAIRTAQVLRTTCEHADGRRENVAEHTFMLHSLAQVIVPKYYPDIDMAKVHAIIQVHDLSECYVGDTPSYGITDEQARHKRVMEAIGLNQLTTDFEPFAPDMISAALEYEEQKTPPARLVKILDKCTPFGIQFACGAAAVRKVYTPEEISIMHKNVIAKFKPDYPEFELIFDILHDLGELIVEQFIRPQMPSHTSQEPAIFLP